MASSEVIKAVAVTAELCGRVFTTEAAAVFASDLDGFPDAAVFSALTRCRKELKGLLTIQEVISRIDDGRPGVESAWAMLPHGEETSVVWTEEMAAAWGVALPLINDGDRVGARMAFKEAYTKLVADARDKRELPKWSPSFGRDVSGRQAALIEAVRHNRIGLDHAIEMLPVEAAEGMLMSLGIKNHPLLAAPNNEGKAKVAHLLSLVKARVA